MLLEFRIENFRSFRDEQVLSLVASKDDTLPENVWKTADCRALKTAALYGANASGKSNVIKAVELMRSLVVESGKPVQALSRVSPFLLDAKSKDQPTRLEATFVLKGVRYRYGFEVTRKKVMGEWLSYYPEKAARQLFDRAWDEKSGRHKWKWGKDLKGEKTRLSRLTRDDALFLSVAANLNHEQLSPVFDWFRNRLHIMRPRGRAWPPTTSFLLGWKEKDDKGYGLIKDLVLGLLRDADLDIVGVDLREKNLPDMESRVPPGASKETRERMLKAWRERWGVAVRMLHENRDTGKEVAFELQEESGGTQRLFELAGPWLTSCMWGHTMIVDELEMSLHPLLTRQLVSFFHRAGGEGICGQLVFATHDTTLLDPELFRRDQIWFTEKDRAGATQLYSLYEYKEHKARKGEALQKGYLSGRYGALPILGAFEGK